MKAIGYIRVSTDKQADKGVSLEAQEAKLRAMAAVQDIEIDEFIVDGGESAKSLSRPGMERLLAMVDRGEVSTVIIAKLDRLTRSVKDLATLLEQFQKRNVGLVSVSESLDTKSAAGRLVLNIMSAVSQWEREAIGERTRDAMRHKRAKGERVGAVPYGFRVADDGKTLVEDCDEQATLQRIRNMKAAGLSVRAIALALNEQGIRTRKEKAWQFSFVATLAAEKAA